MNADQDQEWRDLLADACEPGCTDATACNYDDAATDDDGSCRTSLKVLRLRWQRP